LYTGIGYIAKAFLDRRYRVVSHQIALQAVWGDYLMIATFPLRCLLNFDAIVLGATLASPALHTNVLDREDESGNRKTPRGFP